MLRRNFLLAGVAAVVSGCASMSPPSPTNLVRWSRATLAATYYDNENVDDGVARTNAIRRGDYDAPTPTEIDGARTIGTAELRNMLLEGRHMTLIDVLDGFQKVSLPNTYWMPEGGFGVSVDDRLQGRFAAALADLTGGDKNRTIVIFCVSRMSWLSHNAVVRAVAAGYRHVLWYRGGSNAWLTAGLSVEPVLRVGL